MKSRMNAVPTADDRERERDRRRDERAEDDEQHDQRHQQAEQLLRPLLDRRELRVAVELGGQARRLDRLADGVLDRDHVLAVLLVDDPVELRLGVGDAAVVGEHVFGRTGRRRSQAGRLSSGRLELGRLELRDRRLDRRLVLRRVEPLALRRGEDEVQDAALLLGELGLDQVGRLLRVRARDLELVLQAAADRRRRGRSGAAMMPTQARDDAPRDALRTRASSRRARRSTGARAPLAADLGSGPFTPMLVHGPVSLLSLPAFSTDGLDLRTHRTAFAFRSWGGYGRAGGRWPRPCSSCVTPSGYRPLTVCSPTRAGHGVRRRRRRRGRRSRRRRPSSP